MKRIIAALALITLAVCLLAACGVDTADVTLPPSSSPAASPEAEPTPSSTPNPDAQVLAECMSLVGMTDEESADALGGGEQNIAADGKTLIGRVYSAELFGEEVAPGTTYDAEGVVNSVSIYLAGADSAPYAEALTDLYGEPSDASEGQSESGSTWQDWSVDGHTVRLYQSYGLCSLELR